MIGKVNVLSVYPVDMQLCNLTQYEQVVSCRILFITALHFNRRIEQHTVCITRRTFRALGGDYYVIFFFFFFSFLFFLFFFWD